MREFARTTGSDADDPTVALARGREHRARPLTFGLALLLLSALHAAPTSAQRLQFVPKAGVYTALGPLTEHTELEPALAVGAAAELALPLAPVALRLAVDYATDIDIVRRVTTEEKVGEVSLLAVVGGVVLRPLPAAVIARPYFLGGAGIKRYAMELLTTGDGDLGGPSRTLSRFTVQAGGGLDVRLGPLALVLEVADYLSRFFDATGDSKLQHDAFGQAGVRITVF